MDFAARKAEAMRFLETVYIAPREDADLCLFSLPDKWGFRPADFAEAAQEAAQASLIEGRNVYIHTCFLSPGSRGRVRGSRADAAVIPGAWVDLDIKGPAHASEALPPSREAALGLLNAMDLTPSLVVDSGWGLQAWWLLDRPRRMMDEAARERALRIVAGAQIDLGRLAGAQGWEVDHTAELARILRVPGTTNWKITGEPRDVHILHESGERYTLDALTQAWALLAPPPKAPSAPLPEKIPTGNRTHAITRLAGLNRRLNVPEAAIVAAALEFNKLVLDPPLPERKVQETVAGVCMRYPAEDSLVPLVVNGAKAHTNGNGKVGSKVVLRPMTEFAPLPVDFVWEPGIVKGALNLLAGDPGYGKGLITTSLAAAQTAHKPFPGNRPEEGDVLWVTYEESVERAIRPRLDIAGADVGRVFPLLLERPDGREDKFLKADDVPLLEEALRSRPFRLMVLDPLLSFIGGQRNINQGNEVRDALDPLVDLAERLQFAILGIVHINKAELSKTLYRISNSMAFVALARSVLGVGDLGDGRRCLAHIKANYSAPFDPIPYSTVGVLHPVTGRSVGSVVWEDPDPEIDVASLFDARAERRREPTRTQECAKAILEMMDGKPVFAEFMNGRLLALGYSEKVIRLGRQAAGVTVGGRGKSTRWSPPDLTSGREEEAAPQSVVEDQPTVPLGPPPALQGDREGRDEEEWTE